jgi:hypothetical protein
MDKVKCIILIFFPIFIHTEFNCLKSLTAIADTKLMVCVLPGILCILILVLMCGNALIGMIVPVYRNDWGGLL